MNLHAWLSALFLKQGKSWWNLQLASWPHAWAARTPAQPREPAGAAGVTRARRWQGGPSRHTQRSGPFADTPAELKQAAGSRVMSETPNDLWWWKIFFFSLNKWTLFSHEAFKLTRLFQLETGSERHPATILYLALASHCPRRRDVSSDSQQGPQGRTADRADTRLPDPWRRGEVLGVHLPQVLMSSQPQACAEMQGDGVGETCVNP